MKNTTSKFLPHLTMARSLERPGVAGRPLGQVRSTKGRIHSNTGGSESGTCRARFADPMVLDKSACADQSTLEPKTKVQSKLPIARLLRLFAAGVACCPCSARCYCDVRGFRRTSYLRASFLTRSFTDKNVLSAILQFVPFSWNLIKPFYIFD